MDFDIVVVHPFSLLFGFVLSVFEPSWSLKYAYMAPPQAGVMISIFLRVNWCMLLLSPLFTLALSVRRGTERSFKMIQIPA